MTLTWIPAARFPLEKDLTPLLSELRRQGIAHYVTEELGQQQLWVSDENHLTDTVAISRQWLSGDLSLQPIDERPRAQVPYALIIGQLLRGFPITLGAIWLSLVGLILVQLAPSYPHLVDNFLFLPLDSTLNGSGAGQYWRLLTPIFLHFSFLHFLFNSVIMWAAGGRIERAKGSLSFLLVIIPVGVLANVAQYMVSGSVAFGGLSGVVYGVIGYIAVYQSQIKHPVLNFNRAMIAFMLVWLVLGFTGMVDYFIAGSIANTAHLVGFLVGAAIGLGVALRDKQP